MAGYVKQPSRTDDGRGGRRRRATGVVVACAAVGVAGVVAAPAAVAEPECNYPSFDFDSDHQTDQVVGAPGGALATVEVRLTQAGGPPLRFVLIGPDGFGTAVTQLTSYEDEGDDRLCTQLVVGSPDETVAGKARAGAVYVYTFDLNSEQFELRKRYTADSPGVPGASQAGARFGAALASASFPQEVIDPWPAPLWVGAPGQDVGGVRDAGRVTSFVVGAEDTTARSGRLLSLATPGVPGDPGPGGRFGSAISLGGVVAIGAPGQRAQGADRAGVVLLWSHDPVLLRQGVGGVPGPSEAGDGFGAAVHLADTSRYGRYDLVVGAPGEDVGAVKDAGRVTVARVRTDTTPVLGSIRAWDQASAGVSGTPEQGDRMGTAVSSALLDDGWQVVAGVPGEDLGPATNAGMVQTLGTGLAWSRLSPGAPGTAETGDRLGATLSPDVSVSSSRLPAAGAPGAEDGKGGVMSALPVGGAGVRFDTGPVIDGRYGSAVAP